MEDNWWWTAQAVPLFCGAPKKKKSFKDEIRKWHVWEGSHSALLFSHSDCSVFLLGHVLYRRGVGGPSGRVSLEDERYVPFLFPSKLINWFLVSYVAICSIKSPFMLPLAYRIRPWTEYWQTSVCFSSVRQICSGTLYLSTKADKLSFLSSIKVCPSKSVLGWWRNFCTELSTRGC